MHGHGQRDGAVVAGEFGLCVADLPHGRAVPVCYTDPGSDIDAVLAADLPTLYRMWEGEIEFRHALRTGEINLTGARWIVRAARRP